MQRDVPSRCSRTHPARHRLHSQGPRQRPVSQPWWVQHRREDDGGAATHCRGSGGSVAALAGRAPCDQPLSTSRAPIRIVASKIGHRLIRSRSVMT